MDQCADSASVKVDHSEQAAAVDVVMHDAEAAGNEQKSGAVEEAPKAEATKQLGSSSHAAAAKDAQAVSGSDGKGQVKKESDKQEDHKKEGQEKEKVLDEGLLCAFRYFDKTGGQLIAVSFCQDTHASLQTAPNAKPMQFRTCKSVTATQHRHGESYLNLMHALQEIVASCIFLLSLGACSAGTGYIKTEDMRRILHNLGLRLSYRQVKDLCTYVAETTSNTGSSRSSRADRIYYRQLTDQPVEDD